MALDWVDQHIEEFIKPNLEGKVPTIEPHNVARFTEDQMYQLYANWTVGKRKAEDRMILLPGRDVWLFEVMARLEDHPTIFKPEFSSSLCNPTNAAKYIKEDYTKCHMLDTGYRGSIAKALGIKNFHLVITTSDAPADITLEARQAHVKAFRLKHQILPYIDTNKSQLVSIMEGHSKYWHRCEIYYDVPMQGLCNTDLRYKTPDGYNGQIFYGNPSYFSAAAQVTLHVAKFVIERIKARNRRLRKAA